ncbi:MAG TPA: hypothetical protein VNV14_05785 [Opitutaceae bacterium]|jgi:hypothetical protein|nr:hypothetical protein [Opitutaceae bacterium]
MRILFLIFATVLISGCSTAPGTATVHMAKPETGNLPEIDRMAMVGLWYGNQPTTDGGRKEWLTRRGLDGSFEVTFRTWKDGKITGESTEVGEWGLSYNLEVVITRGWKESGQFRPASTDSYFWDIYRVETVDEAHIEYTHLGTGDKYFVKRVPDDFLFPKNN